jgi:hypothetical protein
MNTTTSTDSTTTTTNSAGSVPTEPNLPRRSYAELERRYQLLSDLCAQLSLRLEALESSASSLNDSLRQTSEALSSCLALLRNYVTREEWDVLCRRQNELSSLLPGIAEMLGGSSK